MSAPSRKRLALAAVLVLVGAGGALAWWKLGARGMRSADQRRLERAGPREAGADRTAIQGRTVDAARLGIFVADLWAGAQVANVPPELQVPGHGVFVGARSGGLAASSTWGDGDTLDAALRQAVARLRQELGTRAETIDALEVFLASGVRELHPVRDRRTIRSNIHRGIVGLQLRGGDRSVRHSPLEVLATNRSHKIMVWRFSAAASVPENKVETSFLIGESLLVFPRDAASSMQMLRGNQVVPADAVTPESVQRLADLEARWLHSNLHQDGRMTYLYWPSRGDEAPGRDNLIRQWMATVALGRVARHRNSDQEWQLAARNIDYNLRTYYRTEGDLGTVELRGKVKLGAVALAALAIVEHRDRERWRDQELALRRTVDHLWKKDGSFRTFLKPKGRDDNHNFYPGEALLLWATLYAEERDPELLERFMKSFRHYRDWHLSPKRRNPAFVPWHTQAYYLVWRETKDQELADFIFEMNDWLLEVQQWDDAPYDDARGRFYDPDRPFGPPHASSTGVYLEGLIDAYLLASELGDSGRSERYATAIARGLRSIMQLQFQDEVDMFYISKRDRVLGGVRTTVYDNQIRCDNVQHSLMGVLKILSSDLY